MNIFKKQNFDSVKESSQVSGLERTIGSFDLILLGLGAIVGTGIFSLTGIVAAEEAGSGVIISYMIAGLTCIFVALLYTELATMLPTSGIIYTYSFVAFGEMIAWIAGSLLIIEFGFASSTVAISWSSYVNGILQDANIYLPNIISSGLFEGQGGLINLPAMIIVIAVGCLLYFGTTGSKNLNNILVFVKMSVIVIFVFIAAPSFDSANLKNLIHDERGVPGILKGASMLFFSYTGFAALASTAEECKDPKRNLTIGIIGSLICVTIIYMIVSLFLMGLAPYQDLNTPEALSFALRANGSSMGSKIVAVGAIAGMTTVIMMNIYALSRVFYSIARDGLVFKALSKLHPKHDSPHITIIFFTIIVALIAGFAPYKLLAQLSSMSALMDYAIAGVIVVIFRFKYKNKNRPFKCPAIFVIAPVAISASMFLLLTQMIDDTTNKLSSSGQIMIIWIISMACIYLVSKLYKRRFSTNHELNSTLAEESISSGSK